MQRLHDDVVWICDGDHDGGSGHIPRTPQPSPTPHPRASVPWPTATTRRVIDLPGGRARVRLEVDSGRSWDATLTTRSLRARARAHGQPARRHAHGRRGHLAPDRRRRARRDGRLPRPGGSGSAAASTWGWASSPPPTARPTSPASPSSRCAPGRPGRISIVSAGAGEPVICAHGLGATKASFLPTISALADHYRVIAVDLPGFGESDKPIGARLRRPLLRTLGVRADGRPGDRPRPPGREQHGRAGGHRGRLPGPEPGGRPGAAEPRPWRGCATGAGPRS